MEIWMSIVGISMAVAGIPQAYKIWKRGKSEDVSITFWILMIHGLTWWLIYGIIKNSVALIITNSVALILDIFVLIVVIKNKEK